MNYLTGEQVELKTTALRKIIGCRVDVLKKSDVTSRGIMQLRHKGILEEVVRRNILVNGDWIHLSNIKEIVKL